MEDNIVMKVAGHTMGTPEYTLFEAFKLFSEIEMDGVEIIWDDEYKCAIRKEMSDKEILEIKKRLDDFGLAVCALTPYMIEINALDKNIRQKDLDDFKRCINAAYNLGADCIRVYGGKYFPESDYKIREELEKILIESLIYLGEYANSKVVLCVETHFNTLTWTAKETAEIIKEVNTKSVRVLYDQPNLDFSGGEKYDEALEILDNLIGMVHVKDFIFKKNKTGRFKSTKVVTIDPSLRLVTSRVPGEGIIPWPKIIKLLWDKGYNGWLSLEYERRWFPEDLPPAKEGMKKGLEYIRNILKKLEQKD